MLSETNAEFLSVGSKVEDRICVIFRLCPFFKIKFKLFFGGAIPIDVIKFSIYPQ